MKSRNTLIRLKKFKVEEKRRKVAQIEAMIADFQRMGADLDREIVAEQERAGIHDPTHFAYPTYAKAAMTRRENLKRSAGELAVQLEEAKIAHLAYAPEIASVMLRRQQAEAVVMARQRLVDGAVGMVDGALKQLEEKVAAEAMA